MWQVQQSVRLSEKLKLSIPVGGASAVVWRPTENSRGWINSESVPLSHHTFKSTWFSSIHARFDFTLIKIRPWNRASIKVWRPLSQHACELQRQCHWQLELQLLAATCTDPMPTRRSALPRAKVVFRQKKKHLPPWGDNVLCQHGQRWTVPVVGGRAIGRAARQCPLLPSANCTEETTPRRVSPCQLPDIRLTQSGMHW